MIDEFKQIR